jgi:hypothetical protein
MLLALTAVVGTTAAQAQVVLYKTNNFTGEKLEITEDWRVPGGTPWNDVVSSIKVPTGWKIMIYQHGFSGNSLELTKDWVADSAWKNQISSVKIISKFTFPEGAKRALSTLDSLSGIKPIQFRNVATGEYVVMLNDPRGGGALETGVAPDPKGWRIYQAADANPCNVEVKRVGWDQFNWSFYPGFVAVNHATRKPNNTAPSAPHDWYVEVLKPGVFKIKNKEGNYLEVIPNKTVKHIAAGNGKLISSEPAKTNNAYQEWEIRF